MIKKQIKMWVRGETIPKKIEHIKIETNDQEEDPELDG